MEAGVDFASELAEEVDETPIDALPREIQADLIEIAESAHRGLEPAPRSRWGEVSRLYRELTEDWRRGRAIQLESRPARFTIDDARLFVSPRFKLISALPTRLAIELLLAYAQPSASDVLHDRARVDLEPGGVFRFKPGTLVLAHDGNRWRFEFLLKIKFGTDGVYAIVFESSGLWFEERVHWGLAVTPPGRFAFVSDGERLNVAKHLLLYGIARRVGSRPNAISAPPDEYRIVRARWFPAKTLEDDFRIQAVSAAGQFASEVFHGAPVSIFAADGRERTVAEIVRDVPRSWVDRRRVRDRPDEVRYLQIVSKYGFIQPRGHLRIYDATRRAYVGASDGSDTPSDLFFAQVGGVRVWMPRGSGSEGAGLLVMPEDAYLKMRDVSGQRIGRARARIDQIVGYFEVGIESETVRLPSVDIRLLQPHRALFLPDDISDEDLRRLAFLQSPELPERAQTRLEPPPPIVPL